MVALFNTLLQIFQSPLLIPCKLSCHAGQCIGQNIAMVQVLHIWRTSQIQPQTMHQLYLVRLNRRRMRSNMEAERRTIRLDHIERKLPLRFRQRLPRLPDVVSLLLCRQLGR